MNREKIAELILAKYIGKISEKQQQELEQWLLEDPTHQQLFEHITNRERIKNKQTLLALFNQERAWKSVYQTTHRKQKFYLRAMRYAALLLLCFGLGGYWFLRPTETTSTHKIVLDPPKDVQAILSYNNTKEETILINKQYSLQDTLPENLSTIDTLTITIPCGGEFHLTLNDGSEIWLNSETQLRFPSCFTQKQREVYLVSGEAYFKIAKDPKRPFIVHSQNTSIEVLGTEFNLQNYPNEQNIITTLVNGTVYLSTAQQTLKPGEQSIYDKITQKNIIREVDTNLYTAWQKGRFIFKSTPLEDILKQMSRWYNIQFKYEDEQLKTLPFSGNIQKYADGNIILELLKSTGQINFIQQGNVILVNK